MVLVNSVVKHFISTAFTAVAGPIRGNYEVIENAVIGLCALIKITAPSVSDIAQISNNCTNLSRTLQFRENTNSIRICSTEKMSTSLHSIWFANIDTVSGWWH